MKTEHSDKPLHPGVDPWTRQFRLDHRLADGLALLGAKIRCVVIRVDLMGRAQRELDSMKFRNNPCAEIPFCKLQILDQHFSNAKIAAATASQIFRSYSRLLAFDPCGPRR